MIVQNIVFRNKICDEPALFYRRLEEGAQVVGETQLNLNAGAQVTTDTYMNLFDSYTWSKYTGQTGWKVGFYVTGQGSICLLEQGPDKEVRILQELCIDTNKEQYYEMVFSTAGNKAYEYLQINATSAMSIRGGCFKTAEPSEERRISLATIICTYKRNEDVKRNIDVLMRSAFFQKGSPYYGKLKLYVVDNASELPKGDGYYVFHNPNTGGSGGFARGMKEVRKNADKDGTTSVILVDDDVLFMEESFYRLYAFLSLVKEEYRNEVIAGRMFRLDHRKIQYTAAEIWNAGDIQHCGFQQDMTEKVALFSVNENEGAEYSGWWFACFPMDFVKKNSPMPFFLHCDDVEYGLRHGGTPIILNGIQVWHETYEYRQSPVMLYYDTRNPLIVNQKMGLLTKETSKEFLNRWESSTQEARKYGQFRREYMMILGLWDFLRKRDLCSERKSGKYHEKLLEMKITLQKNTKMKNRAKKRFIDNFLETERMRGTE